MKKNSLEFGHLHALRYFYIRKHKINIDFLTRMCNLTMGKAKYEKPCSSIVLLAEMNGILRQSEGNITDDPATEPAMVQEWCDFEDDGETTTGKGFTSADLWNNEW